MERVMTPSAVHLAGLPDAVASSPVSLADAPVAIEADYELPAVAAQLSDTYRAMEEKVGLLNEELHVLAARRLQELQEKERVSQRMESLLKLLPAGVIVLDNRGRVTDCNPAALDLVGEPLLGELWRDVIARSFSPRGDDGHEISLRDGRRVSLATRSLEGEAGQLILLTDMTETRELQQSLSRHQRLSDMGKMMSSLAHQIRTPLSAAMLYASHLCESELTDDQVSRFSQKILARLTHMEQQMKDMLLFVKGDVKLTDTLSVADLLGNLELAMEVPVISSGASYELLNHCPEAQICCNRDSMVSAMMNLVNNSIQAQPSGCVAELEIIAEQVGDQVVIRVSDRGPGMSEQQLAKTAEPFFTTKAQGTGLGLSVVKAVVAAHKGEFALHSELGKGTCVQLSLPVMNEVKGK